jgi:hexosaminidase
VVPEFDMPGHATAWFVGHPELASAPGPYVIEKKFGVFDPTMDPTKKSTYKFLKTFLTEMCALFPDAYFHIGGDENEGKQWNASKEIQEFKKKNNLKDNHALQNYFNVKVNAILKKNGKRMIGWDEILVPELPKDAMIQSWRGKEGLEAAAKQGRDVILSNGYYIDLSQPAWKHYQNDPLPSASSKLTDQEKKHVLGGEATMWAELVYPENIDSRIWPRTAAIAERFWSPESVNSIDDMYRRLSFVALELETVGLKHISYRSAGLRRLAGHTDTDAMEQLLALIEPLKDYNRGAQGIPYSTDLPLTRLPDLAAPDAPGAMKFSADVAKMVQKRDTALVTTVREQLQGWIKLADEVKTETGTIPAFKGMNEMSDRLKAVATIGLESLGYVGNPNSIPTEWVTQSYQRLRSAATPVDESELMIVNPVMQLFQYVQPK